MTAPPTLDISAGHRRLVHDILRAHLPAETRIRVFGSRATGRARCYSDLDLAVDDGRRLTIDETAVLREVFDECDLPYRVDIVDWHAIDDRFRQLINTDRQTL